MKELTCVYSPGLWQDPDTIDFIVSCYSAATGLPVEVFDYHPLLTLDIDNSTYMKRTIEMFGDLYGSKRVVLKGFSHAGALAITFVEKFNLEMLILANPCLMPFGFVRNVSNGMKAFLGDCGIGEGYTPRTSIQSEEAVLTQSAYFDENFVFGRDTSRLLAVGREARKLSSSIKMDTRDERCCCECWTKPTIL